MKKKLLLVGFSILIAFISCNAQIFYKVTGNGLTQPSYIFGTHHLAPLSTIDAFEDLENAFNSCKTVVGEIDMTIPQMELALKLQKFMMAPQDSTLNYLISPEEFEKANNKFKTLNVVPGDVDLNMLSMMRPMFISSMISLKLIKDQMKGFNEGEQLDKYFQEKAKKDGKQILPLETPEMQGELLYTSTPLKIQAQNLVELLNDTETAVNNARKLNDLYAKQDLNGLLELTNSEGSPESAAFMDKLLNKRNATWLGMLPEIMSEGPAFIVVGALHLAGPEGIIEGLRRKGFVVTPYIM